MEQGLQCYIFCGQQTDEKELVIETVTRLLLDKFNLTFYLACEEAIEVESYQQAGVTGVITGKTDNFMILKEVQHLLGVL